MKKINVIAMTAAMAFCGAVGQAEPSLPKSSIPASAPSEVRVQILGLYADNARDRMAAAQALAEMGPDAADAAPFLVSMLEERFDLKSADALQKIGPAAVEPLLAALASKKPILRENAVVMFCKIRDDRAVEPLIAALEHVSLRIGIARALRHQQHPEAVGLLAAVLKDKSPAVRGGAAFALGCLAAPRATALLLRSVEDASSKRLVQNQAREAATALVRLLEDESPEVRATSAEALGSIADPIAFKPLIGSLKDKDSSVRCEAVEAVGVFKHAVAVEPLTYLLKDDEDIRVRKAAAEALSQIDDPRVIKPLVDALADKDVQATASRSLAHVKDPRVIELLVPMLKHEDAATRSHAAEAVGKLRDARVPALLQSLLDDDESSVRLAVVNSLRMTHSVAVVAPLIAALQDDDPAVRTAAASALGSVKDARAVEALIELVGTDDAAVAKRAQISLKKLTRQDFGQDQAKWRAWWKDNRQLFADKR